MAGFRLEGLSSCFYFLMLDYISCCASNSEEPPPTPPSEKKKKKSGVWKTWNVCTCFLYLKMHYFQCIIKYYTTHLLLTGEMFLIFVNISHIFIIQSEIKENFWNLHYFIFYFRNLMQHFFFFGGWKSILFYVCDLHIALSINAAEKIRLP